MPRKNKTTETNTDVTVFIHAFVTHEQKKQDSFKLIELMQQWSGYEPKMWGPSIIGFGSYHYKYASGHEGNAPLIGFSPRKSEFSLYVIAEQCNYNQLLQGLGKFKMGKSCIYFKKLDDLNLNILEQICKITIQCLLEKHKVADK
ncbi:MAG: DUF1801 domain-containing protein [Flavobacteriales bacterium]|nr:DUF1801 domain-containing protein [Flavobacteriales bacterium]